MAANRNNWTDAHYNQITATEDVALDFLREQNILRRLQNPPSKTLLDSHNVDKLPFFNFTEFHDLNT